MAKNGRPTLYSEELASVICEKIADGESLRDICSAPSMPARSSVFKWLAENRQFSDLYAIAREEQADTMADSLVALADEKPRMTVRGEDSIVDAAWVNWQNNRVQTRKWVAAKLKPRVYGERQQLDVNAKVVLTEEQLDSRIGKLLAKVNASATQGA